MKPLAPLLMLALLCAVGCKRNPIDRLIDPVPSGAQPFPTSNGRYVIYDDELKTGGGLGFIPGGQNQAIDLLDRGSSRSPFHIHYAWNGQAVSSTTSTQHLFAGFMLLITPDFNGFTAATGKNLSDANYTQLKFFIRGTLSADTRVRVEGPDDGDQATATTQYDSGVDFTLTSDWQEITMNIPANQFNNVKSFITVTLQYTQPSKTTGPGNGGHVYFDDIRYVQ